MITSNKHLLYILGVDQTQLEYILTNLESFYYSFEREKVDKITGKPKLENGEPTFRKINSSTGLLKIVQTRLYKFISEKAEIPNYVYGGVKGKNKVLNARYHQGNKFIFTTDLKSFFPSISIGFGTMFLISAPEATALQKTLLRSRRLWTREESYSSLRGLICAALCICARTAGWNFPPGRFCWRARTGRITMPMISALGVLNISNMKDKRCSWLPARASTRHPVWVSMKCEWPMS